jgi:hypothetical protein
MPDYLHRFYGQLKEKYRGSLVSVHAVEKIEPNAKEYLNKLAKEGSIERVTWGWYWIPNSFSDIWHFLREDKNFKVVASQTAASVWNGDFVHRDVYVLKVSDNSYGKALQEFGKKRGWKIEVEYVKPDEVRSARVGGLLVEDIEENIIECVRRSAFTDAFATLYANRRKIDPNKLTRRTYWQRVAGSNVRVRQVLEYGYHFANQLEGRRVFPEKKVRLKDDFVKRDVEDAVEKVVELV